MVRNRTENTVAPLVFTLHALKGLWPDIQGLKPIQKEVRRSILVIKMDNVMLFSSRKRLIWLIERARGRSTTVGFFPSWLKLRVVQGLTKKAANYGKREDVG